MKYNKENIKSIIDPELKRMAQMDIKVQERLKLEEDKRNQQKDSK